MQHSRLGNEDFKFKINCNVRRDEKFLLAQQGKSENVTVPGGKGSLIKADSNKHQQMITGYRSQAIFNHAQSPVDVESIPEW